MEEDDIDDDDQPRVVYADAEREGRMARYAAGVGEGADVSASRGSHGASEGAFAPRGPAPGAAPWASDDDVDAAPPPTLLEEEDERARSPARGDGWEPAAGARSDATMANARRGSDRGDRRALSPTASGSDDEDVVDASPVDVSRANRALGGSSARRQLSGDGPSDADREFLEDALGNAPAARVAAAAAARGGAESESVSRRAKSRPAHGRNQPARLPAPRRSPRGKARAARDARAPSRTKRVDDARGALDARRGLASLASLGALARGERAPGRRPGEETDEPGNDEDARGTDDPDDPPRAPKPARGADRKALARRTLAASRAARRAESEEEDIDEDDDGADDGDVKNVARSARAGAANDATAAEDAAPRAEGEDRSSLPGGSARRPPPRDDGGGLMSALALLPSRAPGTAADRASAPYGATGPSQRGGSRGAHRHGSNAPTARLRRIMHRVRARRAQFLDDATGAGPPRTPGDAANPDAATASDALSRARSGAWGRPMRVTLVGECGAEAGLCLWECVSEDDDARVASAAGAAERSDRSGAASAADAEAVPGYDRGDAREARAWLRRGADAPAPGAVLAMDGRVARELSLRGGSRVAVFPPWNEVEVPPSVATGFKRRRVVVGTLVAV